MANESKDEAPAKKRRKRRQKAKPQAGPTSRLQVTPNFCFHCGMPIPKEVRV